MSVQQVDAVKFSYAPWTWPFSETRRAEIDAFFRQAHAANPSLWNGRLLLLRDVRVANRVMTGSFFETDYASMIAALDWGTMDEPVKACFAAAAILSSDNAFIAGEMMPQTRNAGQVLFPSGSLELQDVAGSEVDFAKALERELLEETGIALDTLEPEPGWYAVQVGSRLPIIKVARSKQPAEVLKQVVRANLATQSQPEFGEILVLRGPADLSPKMPNWVRAFLLHVWQRQNGNHG